METFTPPAETATGVHHAAAAAGNTAVAIEASAALQAALAGTSDHRRVLLKAAAGAGKSFALKRLVQDAVAHERCSRVAIIAFTNKQIHPLAVDIAKAIGKDYVCIFVKKGTVNDLPDDVIKHVTIAEKTSEIPTDAKVVVATSHKLGAPSELRRQKDALGPGRNGDAPYDVLFVDEAWQLPHYLFDRVNKAAPLWVGVGDVGQLPPLEVGSNPWRGDPGHNPYRAWPTDYTDGKDPDHTWERELPAVWRPPAGALALWRAFYPEWDRLNCVAAPGDRSLTTQVNGTAAEVWRSVGSGVPTLLEVDGLPPAEAADIDLPLVEYVEALLDELFTAGFTLERAEYDDTGAPTGERDTWELRTHTGDPLVAILATRNQAVDDAADAVDRLRDKHALTDKDIVASTVDSWQGQTNGITIAIHPLTGAGELNDFNSAFGRLAVTCTRATHGLLMVSRPGLDTLLGEAPARPGNPYGEPGNRQLPRQTHRRILDTFARATITYTPDDVAQE
ncbi:AAA family ATPase [Nocardioides cavernae]|uniref:AAA family ATPase n=1 Tax=Nocardioides cavernae TaxID=1921566 RepID=A0ABR8NET9_9ACTN|nr:AAA family ATPase [Nocardioides cavernae]MBD3926092.1 AAA family ATPase [Nocardioides cavernae]MBM7513681.1 hypothetical protein [Nocardioides cavernae]